MNRFFISVLRNIKLNPLFSIINFWGLGLGFVCIIVIAIWVKNELGYDSFHKNCKSIYRVHRYFYDANGTENLHLPNIAPVIAPLIKNEFHEIEHITRVYHTDMVLSPGNRKMAETKVCFTDPDILKIFDFEGLPANKNLLMAPFSVIISDETAMRYFSRSNAIGKILEFKDANGKKYALEVSGVFKKWKQPSHFNSDIFISFGTLEALSDKAEFKNWSSNNYETFALIPYLPTEIDKKLDTFIDKYLPNGTRWTKIRLEGLTDIHFNWYTSRSYVYILFTIALLILVIGSINYMNLNAAICIKRVKEIKIRKIIGASQRKLTIQLLGESVFFCLIALVFAGYIVSLIFQKFNNIFDHPLDFGIRENFGLYIGLAFISIITGIFSGTYPLLILSSFKPGPVNAMDSRKEQRITFHNGLVVFQFVVSMVLIISFLLISKQLNYVQNKELGLDKENIVVIPATPQIKEKLDVFKQQLGQNTNILTVSASKRIPSEGLWDCSGAKIISGSQINPLGFRLANIRVDDQFIPTYKIKLAAGRNFNQSISTDFGYIINESAVYKIGWKSPEKALGQVIEYGERKGMVIGVVKDFYYESLHSQISPIIMYDEPSAFNLISIRITPYDRSKTLTFIEKIWQSYNASDISFEYKYVDDCFKKIYRPEENTKTLFSYFMVLAITVAILGLMGLSGFLIERRTKEVGVRKVNGARIVEILVMLNQDFIKWVAIAFVIACPIAWYAMSRWLQNFAYRTELNWWVFAVAGGLAMAVALLTVSWQSWLAATRNPVEALRYE
jgi:putative ABC transport system permease protein